MEGRLVRPAVLAVLVGVALTLGRGSGARPVDAALYDFSAASAIAASTVEDNNLAGGVLMLADNDGTLFEQGYGSYTATTIVPIASASKWLSGAAIMTLVDEGLIELDAPISTYLAGWTGTKGTITMRQLFSHTSGLVDDHACLGDRTMTLAACVDLIYAEPLSAAPGTVLDYGGVSMQVGARVAEVVTGESWYQLFGERITGPLGMTSTFIAQQNPQVAGGVLSSSGDYTRFLRMLLRGGELDGVRVLSTAAVAGMHADSVGGVPNVNGGNNKYGIGNWIDMAGPLGSALQNASYGAFGTTPWINWVHGYAGIFLVYTQAEGMHAAGNQIQAAANAAATDNDADDVGDAIDNCAGASNPGQENGDRNFVDNSPPYSSATDDRTWPMSDGQGDACDGDDDNDGLSDADEISGTGCGGIVTDGALRDTDGDRYLDGAECARGSDPASALSFPSPASCGAAGDQDGDRLSDRVETCFYATSVASTDTDGDRTLDGGTDGCEVVSVNGDRLVNSGDQGMLATGVAGSVAYHVNIDLNKDGTLNSGDQGLMASFIVPAGQCPGAG